MESFIKSRGTRKNGAARLKAESAKRFLKDIEED